LFALSRASAGTYALHTDNRGEIHSPSMLVKPGSDRVEASESEGARRATEALSRAYLTAALDCVVMADKDGRVLEFNPAAEATFGYTREEALGHTLAELIVPPSLRERHQRAFDRFVETREPTVLGRRLELTGMRADGSEFPVELSLSLVEGEPLLVCGALRDISERKKTDDDLQRLVGEQAALRRVATLVAERAGPDEVFAAVANEVGHVLDVPMVEIVRYNADNTATVLADLGDVPYPMGTTWKVGGPSVTAFVLRTGRPARIDDYSRLSGNLAQISRDVGLQSSVGAPILLEGGVWGAILAASTNHVLPPETEVRLVDFTALVATAISNTQAQDELRRLAEEQAALRRVATLVARGAESRRIFDAVCEETGRLIGASSVNLAQFTPDGVNLTLAGWSLRDTHVPTGAQVQLDGDAINVLVQRTGAAARVDKYEGASGDLAALIRRRGTRSEVGAPVIVEARVWGALTAGWDTPEPAPEGTELRLGSFAELVATAVSNATTRSDLLASRARIVAAGDEARRRIERNLHDGTQQRLVSLGLDLQALKSEVPAELDSVDSRLDDLNGELESIIDDVREISRGLHPALLSHSGLGPALRALARRSPVPVEIQIPAEERYPESIEITVYYVVSEGLANAAKHAAATLVQVSLDVSGAWLRASISDDGRGGAVWTPGSGLVGLVDRVAAQGGHLSLDSPPGRGTRIDIELPLADAVELRGSTDAEDSLTSPSG
jgi:PAS domain S-box-containing protein